MSPLILTSDSQGGLFLTCDRLGDVSPESSAQIELLIKDDNTLGTFHQRYLAVRKQANEAKLVVSTNFVKRYTFDEVDVT